MTLILVNSTSKFLKLIDNNFSIHENVKLHIWNKWYSVASVSPVISYCR